RQQSEKERADRSILGTIRTYMYISIVLATIALASNTIDIIAKPQKLLVQADEQKALDRLVADRIESSLAESSGKDHMSIGTLDNNEFLYRRLRKAVFLNIRSFQANDEILKGGLTTLTKRGYQIKEEMIGRLVAEMPELKAIKLRWLEDEAIPALQKDID